MKLGSSLASKKTSQIMGIGNHPSPFVQVVDQVTTKGIHLLEDFIDKLSFIWIGFDLDNYEANFLDIELRTTIQVLIHSNKARLTMSTQSGRTTCHIFMFRTGIQ